MAPQALWCASMSRGGWIRAAGAVALALGLAACGGSGRDAGLTASGGPGPAPAASRGVDPGHHGTGRHAVSHLFLGSDGPDPGLAPEAREVLFAARDAGRVSVRLVSTDRNGRLSLNAVCDGRARFVTDGSGEIIRPAVPWTAAGQAARTDLPAVQRLRQSLELGPETTRCTLRVQPGGRPSHELVLRREDLARPVLDALDRPPAPCSAQHLRSQDRLATAFHAPRMLAMTCAQPAGRTVMLPDGGAGLNAKIEALTGTAIAPEILARGDPDMALDWSRAPRLDLIYVSYLNLNADFSGYLMARMLAFHAARGTVVRILVPDLMMTATERQLFEGLAVRFPSVQLQPYSVPPGVGQGFEDHAGRFHRMSHVKLFATIAAEPGRSVAMVGGRNLHDGYFFPEPLDLTDWPHLHQYDPTAMRFAGGFASYVDFEIAVYGDAAVRDIVRQMGSYWHRDHDSQRLWTPQERPAPAVSRNDGPRMRSFLSVPYADGFVQEALFVDLFDAAEHRIDIASPYLNLTPALDAALRRATARGVAVRVVTTVRVREASDLFVTTLNRRFANEHADRLRFYDFDPYPRMLHSKLMVFDNRLAVVTSTNLNQRSFWHDTENGLLFLDPAQARRINGVIDGYVAQARRVTPDQPVNRFVLWLFRWQPLLRAF